MSTPAERANIRFLEEKRGEVRTHLRESVDPYEANRRNAARSVAMRRSRARPDLTARNAGRSYPDSKPTQILKFLQGVKTPLSYNKIAEGISAKSMSQRKHVMSALQQLALKGQIERHGPEGQYVYRMLAND